MENQPAKPKGFLRRVIRAGLVLLLIYVVLSVILAFPFAQVLFNPPAVPGGLPSLTMSGAEKIPAVWAAQESVQVDVLNILSSAGPKPINLSAWWVFRDSSRGKPTVIFVAGNGGLNPFSYEDEVKLLTGLGYNCLLLDQRGYGRSAGEMLTYGWYERGDFDAVLDTLVNRYGIDRNRIGLWGFSMGASNAASIAAAHPEIKAVMLFAPWSDPIPMAVHYVHKSFLIPPFLLYLPVRLGVEVGLWRSKAEIIDPAEEAKKVHCPAIVIHGDADDIVPPELTKKLFEALAGPKELVVVPGAHHNDLIRTMGNEQYLELMKLFFTTNLKLSFRTK